MTRRLLFKAIPYAKEDAVLALESGAHGLIVPDAEVAAAQKLARCEVIPESAAAFVALNSKKDEERAAALIQAAQAHTGHAAWADHAAWAVRDSDRQAGQKAHAPDTPGEPELVVLTRGWQVIPVENLIAAASAMVPASASLAPLAPLAVEVANPAEAALAGGILERGVQTLVLTPEALPAIKAIIAAFTSESGSLDLSPALITAITPAGMGHRVCVDTTSILHTGQGMLVGNSAAFAFLVNAETEPNEYVAARPFRINAGSVHTYARMPGDRTAYLEELRAGSEVLIVSHTGAAGVATVGRVKTERRPMLLLEAEIAEVAEIKDGTPPQRGAVFLQNAETIRLVTPEGAAVSVVDLKPGDQVLCHIDRAGRHFGVRITEDIREG